MLKRNLIIIAIMTIILSLSANTFGQDNRKSKTSKSKARPKVNRVNMEDGVFLPGYRTTNKRKKSVRNVKNFSSTTQPFADGLVLERKRKTKRKPKTQNLLPYMEQSNLRRRKVGPKSIVILDQDTQTIKAQRKRKRNK